jgi:hypothetical protein
MSSWKTTATGILSILAVLASAGVALLDGNPTTNPDWAVIAAAVMAGLGLIAARDNGVTSEQAGAKK